MSLQNFVHRITDKRVTHKERSVFIRVVYVFIGIIITLIGVPLLIIFPEAGIPLVLVGLGFLSLEYVWAGTVLLWFAGCVDRLIRWYRKLPRKIRYAIEAFFIVLAVLITWLVFK